MSAAGGGHQQAIAALEARLAGTPRGSRPYEHAALAYRIGLARAESPAGDPRENLRRALASYDVALAVFDPRFDPVEHARVLNAAGAAHRGLGRAGKARELFERATEVFRGRNRDEELAAALNNLGLVCSEQGDTAAALTAFDSALPLFDEASAEGRRGRAATLHNRGLAQASLGTKEALEAALGDYDLARASAGSDDAPYHHAMLDHSNGVAAMALSALVPEWREQLLHESISAFEASLQVFARSDFPFQHALAKHNLGRALAATGDGVGLRHALACFEETLALLDPRLHGDAWRHAHAGLEEVEAALRERGFVGSRPFQFVSLVAEATPDERRSLLRERLSRLVSLPDMAREKALAELARASTMLDGAALRLYVEAEIGVLMELPNEGLESALAVRVSAHRSLPDDARSEADVALDLAVGDALGLSQRILVRDHLASLGFERP
ncbi:MAG: tetratricopeptide repeat protein [Actinomycetota bacterium]|nr:tetratricopeptide repeat protein [Acidimicrobiia bacterium]MDQ3293091.1 tetratricopeptide repeat protein [Actinomycetota bacterium]